MFAWGKLSQIHEEKKKKMSDYLDMQTGGGQWGELDGNERNETSRWVLNHPVWAVRHTNLVLIATANVSQGERQRRAARSSKEPAKTLPTPAQKLILISAAHILEVYCIFTQYCLQLFNFILPLSLTCCPSEGASTHGFCQAARGKAEGWSSSLQFQGEQKGFFFYIPPSNQRVKEFIFYFLCNGSQHLPTVQW